MKRIVIILLTLVAVLNSCTKEVGTLETAISFQTANYLTKASSYANGPFGVCAWYKGVTQGDDVDYYMNFLEVTGVDGSNALWSPVVAYYWPRTGAIDFTAYSPYSVKPSVLTETALEYNDITVSDADIMYSDRSLGRTAQTSASNGVPILFHHALAQVKFRLVPTYTSAFDPVTNTYTRWEIIINKDLEVSNILNQGSLKLSTADRTAAWTLPENAIWTPASGSTTTSLKFKAAGDITGNSKTSDVLEPADGSPLYVMPQKVAAMQLQFNVTIKTYRAVAATEAEAKAAAEAKTVPDFVEDKVDINSIINGSSVAYWAMNTITIYTLKIAPARGEKIYTYIQDRDHNGIPDRDEDGNIITTNDPNDALYVEDPQNPGGPKIPVYVKDENHDGHPDIGPDGQPEQTTNKDDALVEVSEQPLSVLFDPAVVPWEKQ